MLPTDQNQKLSEKLKLLSDYRVIGLLVFGVIVLLVSWSGLKVMQQNYELQKKEAELRQENAVKKLENQNLELSNAYLESSQYLELTARRQFNKAAPGEKLYLVPEEVALGKTVELPQEKNQEELKAEEEADKSKYQQNFEDWLEFLFGSG